MNMKTSILVCTITAAVLVGGLSMWSNHKQKERAVFAAVKSERDVVWNNYVSATQNSADAGIIRDVARQMQSCHPQKEVSADVTKAKQIFVSAELACVSKMKEGLASDSRQRVLLEWVQNTLS